MGVEVEVGGKGNATFVCDNDYAGHTPYLSRACSHTHKQTDRQTDKHTHTHTHTHTPSLNYKYLRHIFREAKGSKLPK